MDAERVRAIAKKLAHVEETLQWGENLVFWVGDKAIGGKMFALVNMDAHGGAVMSFSAGPERYPELLEHDGVVPAPYMARLRWVALEHWGALDPAELATCLADAHALTYAKLPQRTRDVLALPAAARRKLIDERRRQLAARKAAEEEEKRHVALQLKVAKGAGLKAAKGGASATGQGKKHEGSRKLAP